MPDQRRHSALGRASRSAHAWVSQIADPLRMLRGLRALRWYWSDYRRYRTLSGAEPADALELLPALHERTRSHELDAHYFHVNAWAMRRILAARPPEHLDVASQAVLAALLSAALPVTYLDYRPLGVQLSGLSLVGGSLVALPYADASLTSVSCLHVAEHVGLGRYGDPLDPAGTRKAAGELERVLAPAGNLYFAVPVGRPRVCFNAHRVHSVRMIIDFFPNMRLAQLAGVDDSGVFREAADAPWLDRNEYACGMFHFVKQPA